MTKHNEKDIDKECPICGGVIWGRGQLTILEGAKMIVCQSCATHGKNVIQTNKSPYYKKRVSERTNPPIKKKYEKSKKTYQSNLKDELMIIDDYDKKIRKVRQKHNLTQGQFAQRIHEKESLIRRIETKKVKPTIELANKIEREFKIKLLEEPDIIEVDPNKYMKKNLGSSLGDIAFIKKKKED